MLFKNQTRFFKLAERFKSRSTANFRPINLVQNVLKPSEMLKYFPKHMTTVSYSSSSTNMAEPKLDATKSVSNASADLVIQYHSEESKAGRFKKLQTDKYLILKS